MRTYILLEAAVLQPIPNVAASRNLTEAHCAGQENEGGEQPDQEIDWQQRLLFEAAAVLELLITASLMLTPVDLDALRYICRTAKLLQVRHASLQASLLHMGGLRTFLKVPVLIG